MFNQFLNLLVLQCQFVRKCMNIYVEKLKMNLGTFEQNNIRRALEFSSEIQLSGLHTYVRIEQRTVRSLINVH